MKEKKSTKKRVTKKQFFLLVVLRNLIIAIGAILTGLIIASALILTLLFVENIFGLVGLALGFAIIIILLLSICFAKSYHNSGNNRYYRI